MFSVFAHNFSTLLKITLGKRSHHSKEEKEKKRVRWDFKKSDPSHWKVLIPKTLSMYLIKNIQNIQREAKKSKRLSFHSPLGNKSDNQWQNIGQEKHLVTHTFLFEVNFQIKELVSLGRQRGTNLTIIPWNFRSKELKTVLPLGLSKSIPFLFPPNHESHQTSGSREIYCLKSIHLRLTG